MNCEFCKKTFASKKSFMVHQRTARYCLVIQKELSSDKSACHSTTTCPGCEKTIRPDNLLRHNRTCKALKEKNINDELRRLLEGKEKEIQLSLAKKEEEIRRIRVETQMMLSEKDREIENVRENCLKLEQKIEKYESQMFEMARQPKTVSSKVVVNLPPITQQHLEDNAKYLSLDHIKRGMKGYAQYALEYPLKGMVTCTDYSRRKIKYNDENGEIVVDPEMRQLRQKLFAAIRGRNQSLINEHVKELQAKASSGEWDRSYIQDLVQEMVDINRSVGSAAMGDSADEIGTFIKEICMGLASSDSEM